MLTLSVRNFVIGTLLCIAFGLSAWSIIMSKPSKTHFVKSKADQPDAFMENAKATVMNKDGTPALKIETPKLVHFEKDDITELTTPHVTIYRQSPQPWHVNSNFAKTKKGLNEITFWDHVVIHHLADAANPVTTLETSTLTVVPGQQTVKTSDAVIMTQPATTIRAVGMLANWDEGTVQLLSQAREEYVPSS